MFAQRSAILSRPIISSETLISRETLIVFLICTLDMVSSAVWFQHGAATEANPLLRPFAQAGTIPFLYAKSLTFIPALVAAEWYRRREPELVRNLLRAVAVAYVAIYCVLTFGQLLAHA